jgi:hypothetical protein
LTKASFDPVAWLVANKNRHKADHSVHTIEELEGVLKREGLLNQGSTLFRDDTYLHPNKIANPKPILGHAERTNIG